MNHVASGIAAVAVASLFASGAAASDRLLGLALADLPQRSYDEAVHIASGTGVRFATLPLVWDEIETKPGVYAPATDWLAIAAAYYPSIGWKVALELNPIDTLADRRPAWLRDKAWDDPQVVVSYQNMLRQVLERASAIDLTSLAIGNEADVLLGEDDRQWQSYGNLVKAAREVSQAARPSLKIGVKTTFASTDSAALARLQRVIGNTDIVMITYYPLDETFRTRPPDAPAKDFDRLSAAFPGREIHLAEIGYPSGTMCSGGEAAQAAFVSSAFAAWDNHAEQITAIYWDWMTDVSVSEVEAAAQYYQSADPCFAEFIGTLGLETHDLKPKAGWIRFSEEAAKRFQK